MCAPSTRKSHCWQHMAVSGFSCPPPARGFRQRTTYLIPLPLLCGIDKTLTIKVAKFPTLFGRFPELLVWLIQFNCYFSLYEWKSGCEHAFSNDMYVQSEGRLNASRACDSQLSISIESNREKPCICAACAITSGGFLRLRD